MILFLINQQQSEYSKIKISENSSHLINKLKTIKGNKLIIVILFSLLLPLLNNMKIE
jgi:hypothetical protein